MPESITFDVGAYLACGASTAFHALKKMDVSGRDVLAVFGQGPVGLAATMFGTAMGARVIAVDVSAERLRLARIAGAWETVDNNDGRAVARIKDLTHGEGADASLEAVGRPETRVARPRVARPRVARPETRGARPRVARPETRVAVVEATRIFGRSCLVGEGGTVTYEATPHIIHRHLTLIGSWTFSTFGLAEAAQFVADRGLPLERLITGRVPLSKLPAAYEEFERQQTGKMVAVWDL